MGDLIAENLLVELAVPVDFRPRIREIAGAKPFRCLTVVALKGEHVCFVEFIIRVVDGARSETITASGQQRGHGIVFFSCVACMVIRKPEIGWLAGYTSQKGTNRHFAPHDLSLKTIDR